MKRILPLYAVIAHAVLSVVVATAQTGSDATKHYERDGLAFDYPAGWEIAEGDSEGVQTVTLARKGSVSQIVVTMQDGLTSGCDFQSERKKIAEALNEKLASNINAPARHDSLPVTSRIAGLELEGAQLRGLVNHRPVTGAVYLTRLNQHFVSLSYTLAANDEQAQSAWNRLRTSLTIEPPVLAAMIASKSDQGKITAGVLNGRAISLPKPDYPKIARSAHAAGTVTIQVIIDETGNVISTHAISGHPLLQAASVAAAKAAIFYPTKLCGQPVRVTGVITYNFVAQ